MTDKIIQETEIFVKQINGEKSSERREENVETIKR